jgi:NTP pyrophosphatase (non-canonical NTP hydrolase)
MIAPEIIRRWDAATAGREQQVAAAAAQFRDLVRLMADLRGPQGCPWDREQSLASLRQYVREEADEVCQAIDRILEAEAAARHATGLPAADPRPPAVADKARTKTKGLTIEHHPHHADFDQLASAAGAPLPALDPATAAELDRLYRALQDELGDLLLQSVFMGDILYAMGRGGVEISAGAIVAKLIRRHPHVYGETAVADSAEVLANWERIKQRERDAAG